MDNRVKIYGYYESENGEREIETLWSIKIDNDYIIDNIPFYLTGISLGDRISALEYNGELWIDKLLQTSGHSTIQVIFFNKDDVLNCRNKLRELDCESELSDVDTYISIDIPPSVNYNKIKKILDDLESNGILSYKEACLAH